MVKVNISIPVIDYISDVEFNEKALVQDVVDDMIEFARRQMGCQVGNTENLILCVASSGQVMSPELCIDDYHLTDGESLLLI